jgi:hypothetical protein
LPCQKSSFEMFEKSKYMMISLSSIKDRPSKRILYIEREVDVAF